MPEFFANFEQLHFIRPWAFSLLIPALLLFFWAYRQRHASNVWSQLIDPHLLQWLMPNNEAQQPKKWLRYGLLCFWLLAIVALSGPSWEKLPQPTYSSNKARIVVLDLSLSMDATDLEPSRLSRAKFKLIDLLEQIKDGQTGLVVFAGDAFILSPLTTDADTIKNLLQPLSTGLMPIKGSQPQRGIDKAIELLENAGQKRGEILWLTDGAESSQLKKIETSLSKHKYKLKILTIGSTTGAPIKLIGGGFLKDNQGNIVIPRLNYGELTRFAEKVSATITPLASDSSDIDLLLEDSFELLDNELVEQDHFTDSWLDSGFWLIFLLLPLVLFSFKNKNILASFLVVGLSLSFTPKAQAEVLDELFLNKNQQAKKQLDKQDYDQAYSNFEDPSWKAVASYKNEDFGGTLEALTKPQTAGDYYNKANALTQNGDYEGAIATYQKALELNPSFEDAKANLEIAKQLMQLEEQQQESEDGDQQDEQQSPGEDQQQQEDGEQKPSDEQQEQQESDQEQNSQDQQPSEEDSQQQQEQQPLTPEELQAQFEESEKDQELKQWLNRISDDPGRLLREKMQREYRRRGHRQHTDKKW